MHRLLPLALVVVLAPAAAQEPARGIAVAVSPACCAITFTAYALGIFPIEGRFAAFAGRIEVPATGGTARAEARIEAASLSLDDALIEADVKAPHFLDVTRFPEILFSATQPGLARGAQAARLTGNLTIKGVTLPVTLALAERDGTVTAEARISRSAYGITARPVLAGDTIRIRVTAPLPR